MPSPPLDRARPTSAREYQALARNRLIESRLTPNAISLTGLALCLVAAGLIFADYWFLGGLAFILGSVCDTLDGRYSRMSGKGTSFGAFLDSTLDRMEEGIVLTAVAYQFSQAGNDAAAAPRPSASSARSASPTARCGWSSCRPGSCSPRARRCSTSICSSPPSGCSPGCP